MLATVDAFCAKQDVTRSQLYDELARRQIHRGPAPIAERRAHGRHDHDRKDGRLRRVSNVALHFVRRITRPRD
jgi:hypothetical protein